jgi:hypothetical protein
MEIVNSILGLFSGVVIVGGGLLALLGAVGVGTNLKDHNGPAIGQGAWQIVGGALIILAGAIFSQLKF